VLQPSLLSNSLASLTYAAETVHSHSLCFHITVSQYDTHVLLLPFPPPHK